MIFDPFQTLGYVEDINVFVQPSDTVPYWSLSTAYLVILLDSFVNVTFM